MLKKQQNALTEDECLVRLKDQLWRMENLYWIENKAGALQRFRLNTAQRRLHEQLWFRNDILKARQLGISTYVSILILDMMLFTNHFHAGVIDKTLTDAQQKLGKIRFAWEYLDYLPSDPSPTEQALALLGSKIKESTGVMRKNQWRPLIDARTQIAFSNGSDVRIGTNLRGGTLQMLHVSELAHVSLHAPCRAQQIRTGAINTVPSTGYIIKESTHEGGKFGVNYELTHQSMENAAKEELSPLDFRFFFFSWHDHDEYLLKGRERWSDEMERYFHELETKHQLILSSERKRWYARMSRLMGSAMKQEYPSTAEEAFAAGDEHSIYGAQLTQLWAEGKVGCKFSFMPKEALFTSWDLGLSDHTAIWLVQSYGAKLYWLDYYSANQQPLKHFSDKMKEWEEQYGPITNHFLPHDAAKRDPHGQSYVENLATEGILKVRVVPRTSDVWRGINQLRDLLTKSFFHPNTLLRPMNVRGELEPSGLEHLELYRSKAPSATGSMKQEPLHDGHSHAADAARTLAEAFAYGFLQHPVSSRPRQAKMYSL